MGMTRKLLSLSTFGLVDWRSDKERTAAYARGTRKHARRVAKEAKKQTKIMQEQRKGE